jgi:signal transduction histidine kinase
MDLNEVVGEVVRLLEPEMRQHAVTVHVHADARLPALVADRIQIEQVILNLVRNAVEAMREMEGRRELDIRTTAVGDNLVEVSVRDTGPGLQAALVDHIFDPFFSTKAAGLGMGLSISRTIIEAHQGRLWTSPSGAGAHFHFTLPAPAHIVPASKAV